MEKASHANPTEIPNQNRGIHQGHSETPDQTEVIVGGYTTGGKLHENVVSVEKTSDDPTEINQNRGIHQGHSETPDQTVVIVGGYTGGKLHENVVSVEKTSDAIATWSSICADCECYSVCSEEDCLFVSGGCNRSTRTSVSNVQKFCSTTGKWTDLPDMIEARNLHGLVCLKKKLYFIGGCLTEKGSTKYYKKAMSMLDTQSLALRYCKEMPEALRSPGIAAVRNQILVFGGYTAAGDWSKTVLKYNPVTDTWTKCQSMPKSPDCYHRTAAVGNKVFIGQWNTSFFLQYDVPSDQWVEITTPVKTTWHHALGSHKGRILALGGLGDMEKSDYVQSYDPSNKVWCLEKQTLPLPLYDHWAVVLSVPTSK